MFNSKCPSGISRQPTDYNSINLKHANRSGWGIEPQATTIQLRCRHDDRAECERYLNVNSCKSHVLPYFHSILPPRNSAMA